MKNSAKKLSVALANRKLLGFTNLANQKGETSALGLITKATSKSGTTKAGTSKVGTTKSGILKNGFF